MSICKTDPSSPPRPAAPAGFRVIFDVTVSDGSVIAVSTRRLEVVVGHDEGARDRKEVEATRIQFPPPHGIIDLVIARNTASADPEILYYERIVDSGSVLAGTSVTPTAWDAEATKGSIAVLWKRGSITQLVLIEPESDEDSSERWRVAHLNLFEDDSSNGPIIALGSITTLKDESYLEVDLETGQGDAMTLQVTQNDDGRWTASVNDQ